MELQFARDQGLCTTLCLSPSRTPRGCLATLSVLFADPEHGSSSELPPSRASRESRVDVSRSLVWQVSLLVPKSELDLTVDLCTCGYGRHNNDVFYLLPHVKQCETVEPAVEKLKNQFELDGQVLHAAQRSLTAVAPAVET